MYNSGRRLHKISARSFKMAASSTSDVVHDADCNESDSACIFPGFADVNEFSQQALKAVLQATRSSNGLPVGDDYEFYSTFRSVRDVMDIEGRRILGVLQRILRHQNVKGNIRHGSTTELEDKFDILMDVNDQLLERVGASLDEASGLRKEEKKLVVAAASYTPSKSATSWNKKPPGNSSKPAAAYRLLTARNIQRPQLRFQDKIDNSNNPYRPQIRNKPHAVISLEESLHLPEGVTLEDTERPDFVYPHPYRVELERFRPSPEQLKKVTPQEPQSVRLTPLMMVETSQQLDELLAHLKTQVEFAVDLEAHTYRSFQGLTCLMQISTRSHDYIVDVLELRSEMYKLNEVFADPSITKVLHGADMDIVWLQRDFGVYVVNMFDTGQAARVLGFSRFSLAHLMMNFCRVEPDKQFQLADWRIRPLPAELVSYAREDTHYLLYIYDMMRNQLIDQGNEQANLLVSVYDRSAMVASKVYRKPCFSEWDHLELYRKSKKTFSNQQMAAFKELFNWRDKLARVEDESLGYVLPNHMLLQIAEILPRERQGVLACCNPIPPLVRQSLPEIHNVILHARELALVKVEKATTRPSVVEHPKYDADSILNCPHDMSHLDNRLGQIEQKIAETGLVATSSSMFGSSCVVPLKDSPTIAAFQELNENILRNAGARRLAKEVKSLFASPFMKYILRDKEAKVKPQRKEMWKMKPPTGVKRKAEDSSGVSEQVDLDAFEPEFVPPTKRTKADGQADGPGQVPEGSSLPVQRATSLFQPPPNYQGSATVSSSKPGRKTDEKVERQIKSLRQEVSQKKKKEKKKDKAKRKEKEAAPASENGSSSTLDSQSSVGDTSANIPVEAQESNVSVPVINEVTEGKKKTKNKNKKLTIEDVQEKFSTFDYSAAEANLSKAKKQKTDVYDSALPKRGSKEKVKKTKLSGPKSNKSISFDPSMKRKK
ncbi:exosome component 10 isoform X2 [Aplysia californica]|uniref:Exosome component 10 isoform X2 n=1 Tax=Aplysia californica TaxID=6500 RepID=A0ABM0JUN4_APLCA|nr:exosome component 10 isoform X2 [Aplysia californica]